ncbi:MULTISPECIES: DUF4244 domain-containing protein [Brevibacterium]|uniref:DUF4244 domain-containing protein n=1 Tax=Brevibacterium casei TaxID=33889 RepID=A0A7T4DKU6_9MICO|nr:MULTISPECIES: DUF4244 domain-containing protein [Brevibacterium]QQB15741.1 DUF4244 domain-containing protein [Brevibacterium casei]
MSTDTTGTDTFRTGTAPTYPAWGSGPAPAAGGDSVGSGTSADTASSLESAPRTDRLPADHSGADDHLDGALRADAGWGADTGATTAEYAITTLAACGFAALLVVILKSEPIKELVTGVIQAALGLGA